MWVLGFYIWDLSLTTKSSEFKKCNMVILKNYIFRWTLESWFGPFGNKLFIYKKRMLITQDCVTFCGCILYDRDFPDVVRVGKKQDF